METPGSKSFHDLIKEKMHGGKTGKSPYMLEARKLLEEMNLCTLWTLESRLKKKGYSHQISARIYRLLKKGRMKKENGTYGIVAFRINGKILVTTEKHLEEVKKLMEDGKVDGYWVF